MRFLLTPYNEGVIQIFNILRLLVILETVDSHKDRYLYQTIEPDQPDKTSFKDSGSHIHAYKANS